MYKHRTTCRACGSNKLSEVFDLGVQPLANDFRHAGEESSGHAPLKLMSCDHCTNAQLSVVVDPNIIYRNYPYVTSKSQTMQTHFGLLLDEIKRECTPKKLLEIGSNDGFFLEYCKRSGVDELVGVDPARNLEPKTGPGGIEYICSMFDSEVADYILQRDFTPDVIVARHVFCHIDDWKQFMGSMRRVAGKDTLIVIEVPYVMDMIKGLEFDTIYHEHLDYMSIRAMQHLLLDTFFHLHKVVRFSIHGGAIVMMLRSDNSGIEADSSVEAFLAMEILTPEVWQFFSTGASRKIYQLKDLVERMPDHYTICGFGASAKSTVWINACEFTEKDISFICDCTPQKQGKYSPGSNIQIVPEAQLLGQQPECAVLFAWNFKQEILKKNHEYVSRGGRWLIPDIHIATV